MYPKQLFSSTVGAKYENDDVWWKWWWYLCVGWSLFIGVG